MDFKIDEALEQLSMIILSKVLIFYNIKKSSNLMTHESKEIIKELFGIKYQQFLKPLLTREK